jgi:hypothetical protein
MEKSTHYCHAAGTGQAKAACGSASICIDSLAKLI